MTKLTHDASWSPRDFLQASGLGKLTKKDGHNMIPGAKSF